MKVSRLLAEFLGRLSIRFTLLMGAMLIVFALVFAIYKTNETRRLLWQQLQSQTVFLGNLGARLVDNDLRNIDLRKLARLDALMKSFMQRSDIVYAQVLDDHRRSIADSTGRLPPFAAVSRDDLFDRAAAERLPVFEFDAATLHVAQPVLLGGELVGVLRFGVSLSQVQANMQDAIRQNAAVVFLFLLLALPLTALLTHRATTPVRKLTDASRRIAAGHLDTAIATTGHGELAELGRSMAQMVRALSDNADAIKALTFIDALTTLPNRSQLQIRVDTAVADLKGADDRVAVLLVDIVRFQRVNDALGHSRGDDLLVAVARRLSAVVEAWREAEARTDGASFETVVGRLSADEFGLMLAGPLSETDLDAALRRIMRVFDEPFQTDDHTIDLSVCIGVALAPADGRDFTTLAQNAGIALQAAKKAGRASHRFFGPELDERAYRRLVIESDLRQAIARGELEVFYQPQVSCTDTRAIGAEALVRWRHPERGLISPGEFIPIAEEAGLIVEIGALVLRQVCRDSARWASRGLTPRLSVNVSAFQFESPDFARSILTAIAEAGGDPHLIELEVTESIAMGDTDRTAAQMRPLREAGVRFAIDDFGTGYSSLSALTRLPFDVLKIDRSFIREIDLGDPERRVLVSTMLGMAKALGMDVIAEGVERYEEAVFLAEQGCPFAQGFLFAKPMPATDFEPWYITHRRSDARLLQGRLREALASLPMTATA